MNDLAPLPGLDIVGHGIYLRPYLPYEPRRALFPQRDHRKLNFRDATMPYSIPAGYDTDDSPPMPASRLLNEVMIEESWDRFVKQLSVGMNVASGNAAFTISATASNVNRVRTEHAAYYAVRSSFIPLFSVHLADTSGYLPEIDEAIIPAPFEYSNRRAYDAFFERYGSHYVRRAWIGGKSLVYFTVLKTSQLTERDIAAGIKASFQAIDIGPTSELSESREKLLRASMCSVSGKGGDELKLASLTSLDEAHYNEWVSTVRENPQTIELEVAGLWTLLKDCEKAKALAEAYRAANIFESLSTAFNIDSTVYFVRGRKFFSYSLERGESEKPRPLKERWSDLGLREFDRLDAAFSSPDLVFASGEDLRRKVHLFYHDRYARLDMDTERLDYGPAPLSEAWPGVDFQRIDTAFALGRDSVYFFCGEQYVRFNTLTNSVDPEYPQPIRKRWKGVTFDRLDAALYWANGKVYFFREDQYIRYDTITFRADAGYPKAIRGDYIEDWKFFD